MRKIHWQWIITLIFLCTSVLFYAQFFRSLLGNELLLRIDFLSFYTAKQIEHKGMLHNLYDLQLQQQIQATVAGEDFLIDEPLPYMHPPFLIPLLAVIVNDDYHDSYLRWFIAMSAVTLVAIALLTAYVRTSGMRWHAYLHVFCGSLLFYPLFISLLKGQDTALMLLGGAGFLYGLAKGFPRHAGMALGLLSIKPHFALILGIPLLLAQRKAAVGFVVTVGGLAFLSVLLIGQQGVKDYVDLLRISNAGDGYGLNQQAMYNLTGLVLRTVPNLEPVILNSIKWGGFVLGLGAICLLWWNRRHTLGGSEVGIATVIMLFVSPHLHFHDVSLLIIPIIALTHAWWLKGKPWQSVAPMLPVLSSSLLLLTIMMPDQAGYLVVYLLMLLLILATVPTIY